MQYEPALHQAVLDIGQVMPSAVIYEAEYFKHRLTELLHAKMIPYQHCASLRTVRIGARLNFRCRDCRRTFNPQEVICHILDMAIKQDKLK